MYHENKRRRWPFYGACLLLLCALALSLAPRLGRDLSEQAAQSVRQAVIKSAAQCYAVEGVYPSHLGYLEKNYGLVLNHSRYYITYEAFSSNLPPTVAVLEKG